MDDASTVRKKTPSTLIGRIVGKVDKTLLVIEEIVLAWGIILLAVLLCGNVVSRAVFNVSWVFVEEVAQAIVVIVTFLGLGYCTRKARHIRMTAAYDQLGPTLRKILIVMISLVTAIALSLMAYWSWLYMLKIRSMGNVTPILRVPVYLILCWVPVGFLMAAVEYVMAIVKNLREKDVYLSVEVPDGYEDELVGYNITRPEGTGP
jgi:C4-dicarboxylate transporter DctQ subunit